MTALLFSAFSIHRYTNPVLVPCIGSKFPWISTTWVRVNVSFDTIEFAFAASCSMFAWPRIVDWNRSRFPAIASLLSTSYVKAIPYKASLAPAFNSTS